MTQIDEFQMFDKSIVTTKLLKFKVITSLVSNL